METMVQSTPVIQARAKPSRRGALAAGAAIVLGSPAVAATEGGVIRWRMATAWPKTMKGPGVSAQRLAARINTMSGGRMQVMPFAAGEIVPAFAVADAVSNGTVEMGHTASFFLQGKLAASVFFTSVPFGLSPTLHESWIGFGGGQALWEELYRPLGLQPFLAGNTGPSLAGWFRREIRGTDDIKGLRIRVSGLGGELYRRMGAVPQVIPPGDVYPSLERGVIDAVELLGPMNDLDIGLQRIAPFCYVPGFNKPNGAAEAVINLAAWEKLPDDLRAIVTEACRAEHAAGLAEAGLGQGAALREIASLPNVTLAGLPSSVLKAAHAIAGDLRQEIGATSALAGRILASYEAAAAQLRPWDRISRVPDFQDH
jgi:TRAP-type mannitol/chloroaromatic compound transport system substrate-binding protein